MQERFYPYTYEPVTNLLAINQADLTDVNQTNFANSGIAISQRVLVSGQTNYPSQNGIYRISSVCFTVFGLQFSTDYSILRGSIATVSNGTTGAGTTFFLYADGDQTAAGSIGITWLTLQIKTTYLSQLLQLKINLAALIYLQHILMYL